MSSAKLDERNKDIVQSLDTKLDRGFVNRLMIINIILLIGVIIHDVDHIRQAYLWSYSIPLSLWALNIVVYVPSAVAIFFTKMRRPSACVITGGAGLLIAIAFAKVHLFGAADGLWGIWSDSFFVLGADALSWTFLFQVVFIGMGVGCASFYQFGRFRQLQRCHAKHSYE